MVTPIFSAFLRFLLSSSLPAIVRAKRDDTIQRVCSVSQQYKHQLDQLLVPTFPPSTYTPVRNDVLVFELQLFFRTESAEVFNDVISPP